MWAFSLVIRKSCHSLRCLLSLPDPSSLPSGSSIQIGGPGSLNVYGGTVKTGNNQHIQIGQPSLLYSGTSNICRGAGLPSLIPLTLTYDRLKSL